MYFNCQKVKRSKVKVTKSRDVSPHTNAITRQWMVISTSNLVRIISTWGSTRVVYFLGQWVKQTGSRNMADIQHIKCKINGKRRQIAEIFTLIGNRGRRIERRCLNLHRKFINNRFCACAVQMLLKMARNATICSTFEVQYGIPTSTRTTETRHLGQL